MLSGCAFRLCSGKRTPVSSLDSMTYTEQCARLREVSPRFTEAICARILENIAGTLACAPADIAPLSALKAGLTNITFAFACRGVTYLYRHPGVGTQTYINRKCEAFAEEAAVRLGIDTTFIRMDTEEGWKVSRFLPGARGINTRNTAELKRALGMLKRFHGEKLWFDARFDPFALAETYIRDIAPALERRVFEPLMDAYRKVERLHEATENDGWEKVLCHNDTWHQNYLVTKTEFVLIDWEYAGVGDPAGDAANFSIGYPCALPDYLALCALYKGAALTAAEEKHYAAYRALIGYCWYCWGLRQTMLGVDVGGFLQLWRDTAFSYADIALALYGA